MADDDPSTKALYGVEIAIASMSTEDGRKLSGGEVMRPLSRHRPLAHFSRFPRLRGSAAWFRGAERGGPPRHGRSAGEAGSTGGWVREVPRHRSAMSGLAARCVCADAVWPPRGPASLTMGVL